MPHIEDVPPEPGEAAFAPETDVKETFDLSEAQPAGGDTFIID
ncbi:hypothetical protein R5W23_000105 [Gemmata sp. JC673]|uniref:Uncharacterized protein n=1 Tax=Gemmata algarum TaxID=2975278 RepID=A0ABU5EUR6_9BACT|nr:hypothetical protein [Gemmata algarum]MDY3557578.1 hypothetical protein [Gemmata algarum]